MNCNHEGGQSEEPESTEQQAKEENYVESPAFAAGPHTPQSPTHDQRREANYAVDAESKVDLCVL